MGQPGVGRAAIVTGGARGIGAAIASRWVADGGRILVADLDEVKGLEVIAALGESASFARVDVTDEGQMCEVFDRAVSDFGRVDAFFSNAGAAGVTGRIEETTLADYRATMDLLLTSTFVGVREAVRVMRPQGSGSIVCTGSVASVRGGLGPHVYTAAKHGLLGLVESVAVEIARYGLRINCVAPGGTVSSLSAGLIGADGDDLAAAHARLAANSSSGLPTTSDDIAGAALYLADAARVNGSCLVVDGGDDVLAVKGLPYYS